MNTNVIHKDSTLMTQARRKSHFFFFLKVPLLNTIIFVVGISTYEWWGAGGAQILDYSIWWASCEKWIYLGVDEMIDISSFKD